MHVLQWIALKDESKEDAFNHVRNNLESYMGDEYSSATWYDWFVTGGGRWNPDPKSQYDENDMSMVIDYSFDSLAFTDRVQSCIELRIGEFNQYRKEYEQRAIDINAKLDSYTGITDYSFELYPLKKIIDMLQGEWDYNSYFFDMETHSTNPEHMLRDIDNGNKNWYLIPVDFHF